MKNKTKGLIAGVAGIALLTGGTTFAVWTAEESIAGGVITNGSLDVAAVDTLTWVDATPNRSDAGHPITVGTWRMVPGDVAEGSQVLDVTVVGDNLVADLGLSTSDATVPAGVSVRYAVYQGDDPSTSEPVADGEFGEDVSLQFAANRDGQGGDPARELGTIFVDEDGKAELSVVVRVTFDAAGGSATSANATTVLGDLGVSLSQVRTGVAFTPPSAP